jgi:hypothetical protein
MKDKIQFKLIQLERNLKLAEKELNDENSSIGAIRKAQVEIIEIKSNINLLNQLLYENEETSGTDSEG